MHHIPEPPIPLADWDLLQGSCSPPTVGYSSLTAKMQKHISSISTRGPVAQSWSHSISQVYQFCNLHYSFASCHHVFYGHQNTFMKRSTYVSQRRISLLLFITLPKCQTMATITTTSFVTAWLVINRYYFLTPILGVMTAHYSNCIVIEPLLSITSNTTLPLHNDGIIPTCY